ncbi:hypothetical protein SAM19_04300 [Brevibacillus laterosporus]|nr:hypothetical protein [Brevibacillus laterosporus]
MKGSEIDQCPHCKVWFVQRPCYDESFCNNYGLLERDAEGESLT